MVQEQAPPGVEFSDIPGSDAGFSIGLPILGVGIWGCWRFSGRASVCFEWNLGRLCHLSSGSCGEKEGHLW